MQALALIPTDWREPARVLGAFADEPWALGLISDGRDERGRWSYLMRRPETVLRLDASDRADPFDAVVGLLGPRKPTAPDAPPFQGGVAGFCGYELGDRVEPLGLARRPGWPDLAFGLYLALLAFDHRERKVFALGRGADDAAAQDRARRALAWLDEAMPFPAPSQPLVSALEADPAEAYEAAVAEVVERIRAGEIFQANIARAWRGRLRSGVRPYDLLERLEAASPAPFAAYLRLQDQAVISNSPERFVQVRVEAAGLWAETRPIKGTAPRGRDRAEDARLAQALSASLKDRAENLMIVDLMRNDLARACAAGEVTTPELFRVESFANVHHLVSTVTGRLAPGRSAIDLLRAAFPPGSITGAPKVQAMKVIAGLEPPRGPFFGAMVWAGFDGALDSNVLIRTCAFTADQDGWVLEARAGAGIVADSDPAAERRETETKIEALKTALLEGFPA